jgi:hypothetical protein
LASQGSGPQPEGDEVVVSSEPQEAGPGQRWSIDEAERLLASLSGVLSARIVARPGGQIEEVHVLTTEEVGAKQTVRNVESALLAHFDLTLDHRKISVAQTSRPIPLMAPTAGTMTVVLDEGEEAVRDGRILFEGHRKETDPLTHRITVTVAVRWQDDVFEGEASAADLPRARLEATAGAALKAVEAAVTGRVDEDEEEESSRGTPRKVSLALDGAKVVDAFERQFVLVAVHAMTGRDTISLAGSSAVNDNIDRSVILATLQATDRWVRGKMSSEQ